jgi:hypothetical protein
VKGCAERVLGVLLKVRVVRCAGNGAGQVLRPPLIIKGLGHDHVFFLVVLVGERVGKGCQLVRLVVKLLSPAREEVASELVGAGEEGGGRGASDDVVFRAVCRLNPAAVAPTMPQFKLCSTLL